MSCSARAAPDLTSVRLLVAVALVGLGLWQGSLLGYPALSAFPRAVTLATVLFVFFAVPGVLAIRAIGFLDPTPVELWFFSIAAGATVSPNLAIWGNLLATAALRDVTSVDFATHWSAVLVVPAVEDGAKVLVMLLIIFLAWRRLHSVVDGFVLGGLIGLGFQVVENVTLAANAVTVAGRGDSPGPVMSTFVVRVFLTGLGTHAVYAAVEFAGLVYLFLYRDPPLLKRLGVAIAAQMLGWSLHAFWNLPIVLAWRGPVALVTTVAAKIAVVAAVAVVPLQWARRQEATQLLEPLAALDEPRLATRAELDGLSSIRLRLAARYHGARRAGGPGRRTVRELQRAQARLAVAMARHPEMIEGDRAEVLALRQRMRRLGLREAVDTGAPLPWWAWGVGASAGAAMAVAVAFIL